MKPLNKHVRIKPIEVDSFVATQKGLYEEIGEVMDVADGIDLAIGTRVYFDSWLAKKYPVAGDSNQFHWFVNYDDLVAYETVSE